MDINVTRQAVSTNEVIFNQNAEQAVDFEIALPDYCPDIVRLLKCRTKPRLISKSKTADAVIVDGAVTATLIYCDEQNKIRSYEQEMSFRKEISAVDIGEYDRIAVSLDNEYINCRAVTSRKVEIHGALTLGVKIIGTVSTDILTDIDHDDVQVKSGSCPQTNPLGFAEKTVVIEEELELGKAGAAVRSIIRCDTRVVVDEAKLMGGKAVVAGGILINTLYCTEEDTVGYAENEVKFHQVVDISVLGESCVCDATAEVIADSVKPRTNLSGEARSLAFECKLCISVVASCDNDIPVLYDAFGTKQEVDIDTAAMNFKKLTCNIRERHLCTKTLDFSENSFGTVMDVWCETKVGQVKICDGALTVGGAATICVLSIDTDGVPQYCERGVDFEYNSPVDGDGNMTAEAVIETVSTAYTVLGHDRLEVRAELAVDAAIYKITTLNVLTGVAFNENSGLPIRAPFIVYYANAGECLWDIAKKYRASCCDIMAANDLDCDALSEKRMLLIP